MAKVTTTNAIITLVTSEDFVIGAQVMVHSLITSNPDIKQVNSINDRRNIMIAVMVTNNISDYSRSLLLSSGFDQIIEIDHIPNPNALSSSIHVLNWIDVGFTKLRIWSLIQFNKILYIDADCIVIADIKHLFIDNKYLNITFAASPDVFPPDNFNGGVMFIKPNINIFNKLLNEMSYIQSYDGGDTGFLNKSSLFKNWYKTNNNNMMRLDFGYNGQRIMHWFTRKKPEYWTSIESKLKIIHYSSSPKPWNIKPSQRMIDKLEIIWHKNWISLNEKMNKNKNKKIALNTSNNIICKTKIDEKEEKIDCNFNYKLFEINDFNKLMTKRSIQFGRVYDGNDSVEFEEKFLLNFKNKFNEFIKLLNKMDDDDNNNNNKKESDFIFNGIPKIIHQIWIGPNSIPKQYKLWSKTWNKYNPNWKYMLWTEETLKENNFEWISIKNKSLYEISENFGEKSDILRLEILYKYGGIYVDFDFECIQTLNIFNNISSISFILGFSNTGILEVNNAMIGSKPNNEILIEIWKSIQLSTNNKNTICRTGPIQLTRCIMNIYSKYNDDILIFPIQCFYPFPNNMRYLPINDRFIYYNNITFGVHHWGVSWNKKLKNNITTNDNDKEEEKINDCNINIIDSIINTSNNIALQSRIMSFLQ